MNVQAFLITFREAFEAILIVGIIITYLKRIGQTSWIKWVLTGTGLAVLASAAVALLFQIVLTGYAAIGSQNYLRIGILFVSAGLLTHMILFMSKQTKNMRGAIESKFAMLLTAGGALNMVFHSFLVTLREGVETVFFFAAISGGDIGKALQSWGALFGIAAAFALGHVVFRSTRKIPLGTFFRTVGFFLLLVAAGLIVQAVGVVQDMRIIGSVYMTSGGEIGHLYNLAWLLPEHPIDEVHYIADTGQHPLLPGQLGVFLKAFLGYSQSPSVEEFLIYWGYLFTVLAVLARKRKLDSQRSESAQASSIPTA